MVAVGLKFPSHIIVNESIGKTISGKLRFSDITNRLSIIDIKTFDTAEHVEIFQNPDRILES